MSHQITTQRELRRQFWQDNPQADRRAYLDDMADQFKREPAAVHELAALLGQAEDFGLLPATLRDFEEQRTN
jgi:hypothetical protein